jgi:hypothetical protein
MNESTFEGARYLVARRRLRGMRVRDALRLDSDPDGEERYRNVLLPVIAAVVDTEPSRGVDELTDATIDAAVSACLAEVDEDPITSLSAFAPACQILARDGQFARLSALGSRVESLDVRLRAERPFLAASLKALGACMRSDYPRAKVDLEASLGIAADSSPVARVARSPIQVADVFLANALRTWLDDRELPATRLETARQAALELADPALYEASELVLAFCRASSSMRTDRLVPAAAPEFAEPRLANYLARRGVRVLFPGQLRAIQGGALRSGSRVIAMPTSSGKTLLAELRLASRLEDPDARAIYLAPYRLLARQVERHLRTGLRAAKLSVKDLGGGFDLAVEDDLAPGELPRVAVMTPERMDALLRLSTVHSKGSEEAHELLDSVRLVIFDEMHLLGRSGRGARLELFTARIRDSMPLCDILGLSAAAEGVQALSTWLGGEDAVSGGRRPTGVIELLWRTDGSMVQRFESSVASVHSTPRASTASQAAADLALSFREDLRPVLIIETTRPLAESAIAKVHRGSLRVGERWYSSLSDVQKGLVDDAVEQAVATLGPANLLSTYLASGLAYHHAGIPGHLLRNIEGLVEEGALRVMAATTTVAEGAHLPFRVVILPHLNFQPRRLEKDLYLNIIGRVGRANVGIEGVVVVLDSDSPTLSGYVQRVLWSEGSPLRVAGLLGRSTATASSLSGRSEYRDVQSQLLAWLDEAGTELEDQPAALASRTFTWATQQTDRQRNELTAFISNSLAELESDGLIVAASPYRLTPLGRQARLAGLESKSCLRLARALEDSAALFGGIVTTLSDIPEITSEIASSIGRVLLESEEVLEKSLWFRRETVGMREDQKAALLGSLANASFPWPRHDPTYEADISMIAGWLLGASFEDLSDLAPVFPGRGLFSSEEPGVRAADAAEQMGRLAYPASWTWSAVLAMWGKDGEETPSWVRRAIEWGVSSASAVEMITKMRISRDSATLLAFQLGPQADLALEALKELSEADLVDLGIPRADRRALNLAP